MAALIVKITDGKDIRRHTARADQLTYASVYKRAAEAFSLSHFKMLYKDDEGDEITMSCDDEMEEAVTLALKMEPAVLRIRIKAAAAKEESSQTKAATAKEESSQTNQSQTNQDQSQTNQSQPPAPSTGAPAAGVDLSKLISSIATSLPGLVQHLPGSVQKLMPTAELDVTATMAANAAANAVNTASNAACRATHAANRAASKFAPHIEGYHPGIECDRSNMCPIVGNRYNLKGHDYDICEAEFSKLTPDEKELYVKIQPVAFRRSLREAVPRKEFRPEEVHPGVTCDKSGMSPIVGPRYHLIGRNYDLCEEEFNKLPDNERELFQRVPARQCGGWGPCGRRGRGWRAAADGPKLAARFVSDVSIHDGMQMPANTCFTKIWRLKNVGESPWPAGSRLLFVGGDQMSADSTVPLPTMDTVAPGDEVDIAADMVAPSHLGRYVGYWRLVGPMGRRKFGQRLWAHIQVVDENEPAQAPTESEFKSMLASSPRGEATDNEVNVEEAVAEACREAEAFVDELQRTAMEVEPEIGTAAPTEKDSAPQASPPPERAPETSSAPVNAAAVDGEAAEMAGGEEEVDALPIESVLAEMGFVDEELVKRVIGLHGPNLEKCVAELASLQEGSKSDDSGSEWDNMLDDLNEMGFSDRDLNKKLLAENNGSMNQTVKTLVAHPPRGN